MTKRAMILTLGLLAGVTVLFAAGAVAPVQPQGNEQVTSNDQVPIDVFSVASAESLQVPGPDPEPEPIPVETTCICPQYPYAYYEDYWSYYAIKCETCTPGSLDAEPGLPQTDCPGCWGTPAGDCPGTCVIVPNSEFMTVDSRSAAHLGFGHHVLNVQKNGDPGIGKTGFTRKRSRSYQIRLNKRIAAKQAEFVVKVVRNSGEPFLAKLVLVSIDPQRIPNLPKKFSHLQVRTEGLGFQIDEPGTTTVESDNVVSEQAGDVVAMPVHPHCYLVRYRHVWYRVLCHASHVR
jgi:hypothetical protein